MPWHAPDYRAAQSDLAAASLPSSAGKSSSSSPVAMRTTLTALPITSAVRFRTLGRLGIGITTLGELLLQIGQHLLNLGSSGTSLGRGPVRLRGKRTGRTLQANGRGAATGCVRKDRTARNAKRLVSHSLQARWHDDRPGACVHRKSRNRAAMVGRRQLPLPAWYRWLDANQYC